MPPLTIRVASALLISITGCFAFAQAQEKQKTSPSPPPVISPTSPSIAGEQKSDDAKLSGTFATYQGKVSEVLDGQTIIVLVENRKLKIRLLGVDAPAKESPLADKSHDNLSRLLEGKDVEVLVAPQETNQDAQLALSGKVMLQGRDIGLEQIRGGFGWHSSKLEKYQTDKDRLEYEQAERIAAEKKLGFWRDFHRCKGDSSQAEATESVQVQVLIDESGKVISAKALCGYPLLQQAAVKAAYAAKFTPTSIKVTGVLTYKFVVR